MTKQELRVQGPEKDGCMIPKEELEAMEYHNEISYGKTGITSHIWNASKNMDNELKRKRQMGEE